MTQNDRIYYIAKDDWGNFASSRRQSQFLTSPGDSDLFFRWIGDYSKNRLEIPMIIYINQFDLFRNSRVLNVPANTCMVSNIFKKSNYVTGVASIKTAFINASREVSIKTMSIKGQIVYMGLGTIIDENREILFMVSKEYTNILENSYPTKDYWYFNPIVFQRSDQVSKFIATQLFNLALQLNREREVAIKENSSYISSNEIVVKIETPMSLVTPVEDKVFIDDPIEEAYRHLENNTVNLIHTFINRGGFGYEDE